MLNVNTNSIVHTMVAERSAWKEAYIAMYLQSTHQTIEDVQLTESAYFSGNSVICTYFLRRKDRKDTGLEIENMQSEEVVKLIMEHCSSWTIERICEVWNAGTTAKP